MVKYLIKNPSYLIRPSVLAAACFSEIESSSRHLDHSQKSLKRRWKDKFFSYTHVSYSELNQGQKHLQKLLKMRPNLRKEHKSFLQRD